MADGQRRFALVVDAEDGASAIAKAGASATAIGGELAICVSAARDAYFEQMSAAMIAPGPVVDEAGGDDSGNGWSGAIEQPPDAATGRIALGAVPLPIDTERAAQFWLVRDGLWPSEMRRLRSLATSADSSFFLIDGAPDAACWRAALIEAGHVPPFGHLAESIVLDYPPRHTLVVTTLDLRTPQEKLCDAIRSLEARCPAAFDIGSGKPIPPTFGGEGCTAALECDADAFDRAFIDEEPVDVDEAIRRFDDGFAEKGWDAIAYYAPCHEHSLKAFGVYFVDSVFEAAVWKYTRALRAGGLLVRPGEVALLLFRFVLEHELLHARVDMAAVDFEANDPSNPVYLRYHRQVYSIDNEHHPEGALEESIAEWTAFEWLRAEVGGRGRTVSSATEVLTAILSALEQGSKGAPPGYRHHALSHDPLERRRLVGQLLTGRSDAAPAGIAFDALVSGPRPEDFDASIPLHLEAGGRLANALGRGWSYREIAALLAMNGFEPRRQKGSHVVWIRGTERVTVPRGSSVSTGVAQEVFRVLGINAHEAARRLRD